MFRVFSGKFCGAIDEKPEGFVWAISLSDLTLSDDQEPISKGVSPTMSEALKDAYDSMTGLIAATGGHATETL
jgi:hypothetical protein